MQLRDRDWLHEKYHGDGKNIMEIANELDCGQTTVVVWLDRHGIQTRDQSDLFAGVDNPTAKQVNFDEGETLSYILGVYHGDGYISQAGNTISMQNDSKVFIESFASALTKANLNPSIRERVRDHDYNGSEWTSESYVCEASSVAIVNWIANMDTCSLHQYVRRNAPLQFVRGMYESDGSWASKQMRIAGTDKPVLTICSQILDAVNINHSLRTDKNDYTEVFIYKNSRERFINCVDPVIKDTADT